MKTLEQINNRFLEEAKEVIQYRKYMELQERCLQQSLRVVDLRALAQSKQYLTEHKDVAEKKLTWLKEEWAKIQKSRTFDYEKLGRIIATLVTQKEGIPYFYATRLLKHTFQIDEENRPFYRVVSFVTANPKDLEISLLDKLSMTMHPYYFNNSPVMKPLPREMESKSEFELMIKKELEVRNAVEVYVITDNDIPTLDGFQKNENQVSLTSFPFRYAESFLEALIEQRYHQNGVQLTSEQIEQMVQEFCKTKVQTTSAAI